MEEQLSTLTLEQIEIFEYCLSRYDHEVEGGEPTTDEQLDLIAFIPTVKGLTELMDSLDDPEDIYETLDWWWYLNRDTLYQIFNLE
jgi:uncharacterized protein YbaP (TraB family)